MNDPALPWRLDFLAALRLLAQARELLQVQFELDRPYRDTRIRTETVGDYGIEDLEG